MSGQIWKFLTHPNVHVVHHLLALVLGVNVVLAGLPELGVQPAPVARVLGQHHALPHHVQELVHDGGVRPARVTVKTRS